MFRETFHLGLPVAEKVLRAAVVYTFLLVAFRIFRRRELGQLTAFDLIVMLTISNVLQNAMIGNDNSVTGGIIGASTLLLLNAGVALLVFRSRRLERVVEGREMTLIKDGRVDETSRRRDLLTTQDLVSAAHASGIERIEDVKVAYFEPNGTITVIRKP
jgi:uncharacterized membrane protein YcaP (DUF421 family)